MHATTIPAGWVSTDPNPTPSRIDAMTREEVVALLVDHRGPSVRAHIIRGASRFRSVADLRRIAKVAAAGPAPTVANPGIDPVARDENGYEDGSERHCLLCGAEFGPLASIFWLHLLTTGQVTSEPSHPETQGTFPAHAGCIAQAGLGPRFRAEAAW